MNSFVGQGQVDISSEPPLYFHDSDEDDAEPDPHLGDYSTSFQELVGDEEDEHVGVDVVEDEDDEDRFLYTGVDSVDVSASYNKQLRDVLETENEESDTEAEEVETSLLSQPDADKSDVDIEIPLHQDVLSDNAPSTSSLTNSLPLTPPHISTPSSIVTPSKLARPFLHPSVSRLRSYTPQSSRIQSPWASETAQSHCFDGASLSPSRFSDLSRRSSLSNLHSQSSKDPFTQNGVRPERAAFRWAQLQTIGRQIYSSHVSSALKVILGTRPLGSPTTLAANGLICIGTDEGRICVYGFKQNLKCICGNDETLNEVGPVTALALSHDHTFVASGHATGYIQLFDLKNPQVPARTVRPTTLAAVMSGRQEGHLQGSRIVSIGFIAGRHTALVSADEHGLSFYHSLGKVLFIEAADVLRILGTYPADDIKSTREMPRPVDGYQNGTTTVSPPLRHKPRHTVLAMMPLPLGTSPHPTDAYNVIALLTPTKLVVVGLKPSPRTWFKCPREVGGSTSKAKSKWRGALSWFPSVINSQEPHGANGEVPPVQPTTPILAFSWNNTLHLIRVSEAKMMQSVKNKKTGKIREVELGHIMFEPAGQYSTEEDILALQWLNSKQVILLTLTTLEVYDTSVNRVIERIKFDGLSLVSSSLSRTMNGSVSYTDGAVDVAHSVRVYKGKIFMLGSERLQVATLLTWADHILSFVESGDFLSAIDLARSYYVGDAPGNRNGLPDDSEQRKQVVGKKMHDLMVASCRYAFSEDRLTDGTHVTPDGRGVDRTSLFEGIVTTCARACVVLSDFDFLFEDLFQHYDDNGISRIFLLQLEPFILDNKIKFIPPRITQRLIALHDEDGRPDLVERVIWHIDPACLDINQAIHLCQIHQLYDALIYIYTRALKDYVAPVVELLGLIRQVQQYRKSRVDSMGTDSDILIESTIVNAYKIYSYLASILLGLTYPSEEPLDEEDAFQAKNDVYTFLFFGRSNVWPEDEAGKLVLTADEEGGMEPTYPYVRLLLRFDAEAFLHSLDIAFEDSYLNSGSQGVNRLVIVTILLEVLSAGTLATADATLVNIFIARNVPKYPQFLQITPGSLHTILIALTEDSDQSSREDRQLAAEYLLSVYNPHESERILQLFQAAGFFRILRSWYRQDRQWVPLLSAYLDDPDLPSSDLFPSIEEVLELANCSNKVELPQKAIATISAALPRLLRTSVTRTAELIDRYIPDLHDQALDELSNISEQQEYDYLHTLISSDRSEKAVVPSGHTSTSNLNSEKSQRYIFLQCRFHPSDVIGALRQLPSDLLDWSRATTICEFSEVYDAAVWAASQQGGPQSALSKAESYEKRLTLRIIEKLSSSTAPTAEAALQAAKTLKTIAQVAMKMCLEQSQGTSVNDVPLEDIWFRLLSSQINCVQTISGYCLTLSSSDDDDDDTKEKRLELAQQALTSLRYIVQESFSSLVFISSTRAVSFPRLFKRLVTSASIAEPSGTHYTEFRSILASMLESYRADSDMLVISKHLIDRDLFDSVAELTRERTHGWSAKQASCSFCRQTLLQGQSPESSQLTTIIVSRTGSIYHDRCLPTD